MAEDIMSAEQFKRPSKLSVYWYILSQNPISMLAMALFMLFAIIAITGPGWVPFDPLASGHCKSTASTQQHSLVRY